MNFEVTSVGPKAGRHSVSEEKDTGNRARDGRNCGRCRKAQPQILDAAGTKALFQSAHLVIPRLQERARCGLVRFAREPAPSCITSGATTPRPIAPGRRCAYWAMVSLVQPVNTLTKLPHSQWVHFEIEYELSGAATYNLRVLVRGQQEQHSTI
jgi:hypothetical protein